MRPLGYLCVSVAALAFLALMPPSAAAAPSTVETGPKAKASVGEVKFWGVTLYDGTEGTLTIDAAFARKHGVEVPQPFQFTAPTKNTQRLYPPETGGAFVKLNFITTDGGKRELVSNLQFTTARVDRADLGVRIHRIKELLMRQALPRAFRSFEEPIVFGTYDVPLGEFHAVAALGKYLDPTIGPMFISLVVLFHPDKEHGVMAVANINPKHSAVKIPQDMAPKKKGQAPEVGLLWRVLRTVKFL